jgi:hypothetical protein
LIRILARLCSPIILGWYLLTRRDLYVQLRTFTFEIAPTHKPAWIARSIIIGSRVDNDKRGTLLKPRVIAEHGEFTLHNGLVVATSLWEIEWSTLLQLTSFSITGVSMRTGRYGNVRLRLFTSRPMHLYERDLNTSIQFPVGPVQLLIERRRPRSARLVL